MIQQESQSVSPAPLMEENRRLRRAVEELSILNDIARAIGASLSTQDIMQTIIHRSIRALHAEQGVITLVDQQSSDEMKTLVRTMVSSSDHQQFHFHQNLLGWMHLNKKPLAMNDLQNDQRFQGVKFDSSIRSLLSVPMVIKSELKGVLTIYNKKDGSGFTEEDQRLLAIIAAQSAQVVENARLYEEEQAFFHVKEEVRLASKIQLELLPKQAPQIPGYDIAGKSIPAQVVGGDYFDFIPIDGQRLAFCVGDISGKGLPASLLMANLQATLRGQTHLSVSAKECVQRSNKLLFHSTGSDKFATLFYGILDYSAHTIGFSNAGHNYPILFSSNEHHRTLETGGVVLSILEDYPFEDETVSINIGDTLLVYSDGITEAMNKHEELFGEERLFNVLRERRDGSATQLVEHILRSVKSHSFDVPQTDDMTLVVINRTG